MSDTFTGFTEGDLVISVYGDGESATGGTSYTDNQASPIVLEELTTSGTEVTSLALPQTTTVNAAGVTENPISGEYGSSSEGTLELAANGQSLVIGGYGVSAAAFDTAGASATYGTSALAQTYTVATDGYTLVPRVVADITANGTVDTSTALLGVFNTNNIRSVATVDGTSFYVSGQGVSGDTTQGVFLAADGATKATAIDTSTDTRTVEIYGGRLYVSRDSKQPKGTGTSNVASYGTTLPTAATAPTTLAGISQTVMLANGNGNSINGSSGTVHLSPENFFFANATTLYVADGGAPKEGGLGDGGLQKWSLVGGTWELDYTLSAGLGLVADTASYGTTGLIGLTGEVVGNTVELYATNETIGDTDQTYLFGIDDTLSDTTAAQAAGESFSTLATAAPDTVIRGIAYAPSTACFAEGTRLATPDGEVAVERLAVGDAVRLADGGEAAVVWIGHRRIRASLHPSPASVAPVRIRAGAFGADASGVPMPLRDLVLSPDHAVRLGTVLAPVHVLVDGAAVVQEAWPVVTYFHVELARHAVILAEGLPVESYLDTGNRQQFANAPLVALHAAFGPGDAAATPCLPLVLDGPEVAEARAALAGFTAGAAALLLAG